MARYLYGGKDGISDEALSAAVTEWAAGYPEAQKILVIPPDYTRFHSMAGRITNILYHFFAGRQVDILPALGSHAPVTEAEAAAMFGDVPYDRFLVHDWRHDVIRIGTVPADFVREASEGVMDKEIEVEANHLLFDGGYDLIVSVGQVVPHEVVGMANYSKNIFVGCGGSRMINASHKLGAYYGLERIMGLDHSPVRQVFDYAEEHFLRDGPLHYILTVTTGQGMVPTMHGLFIDGGREGFEKAVALSQEKNLNHVAEPFKKCVVLLDEKEFKTTWLGNKAVYRTRKAMADGGELLILAPGVTHFGEDPEIDGLIRKYGYKGRERTIALAAENEDLQHNMSAAAHLIHGSSDGRFTITYAARRLTREEVEGVGYRYADYDAMAARYMTPETKDGPNITADGEEYYFISNPALGLWTYTP